MMRRGRYCLRRAAGPVYKREAVTLERIPVRHPLRLVLTSLLLASIAVVRGAEARPLEVPTFAVDPGEDVSDLHVAAGTDGTIVFLWHRAGSVYAQHTTQAGTALGAPVVIGSGSLARIAADTRGGFVAAFTRVVGPTQHLFGRRLDAAGQPLGTELTVDVDPDSVALPQVLGLSTGFAFVWQQGAQAWARMYDPDGVVLGAPFVVGDNGYLFPLAATRLADGGFVVVWHDPSVHNFLGRSFDADGTPRSGALYLGSYPLDIASIAASPAGGFAAVGVFGTSAVRVARFTNQVALIDTRDIESLPDSDRIRATIAGDAAGNWNVVWAGRRFSGVQLVGYLPPRARPLAPDTTPLEPSFALSDRPTAEIATALLPSGSFVNAWTSDDAPGVPRGYANVVSLCTASVHVCGDGVLDPRCEECDAGVANNDTAPDTCRTTCVLPSCGDGTVDTGEACDGGGASPCAGCDATCQPTAGLACGDGILVAGCADQCDDGNAVAGDGCAPTCTLERVPGGGTAKTDCVTEWMVVNPTNVPLVDGRGAINRKQRCVDDDPRCDFDGGTPGSCTFRVRVCANNTDVAGCTRPLRLASWMLTKPSITQAAGHPALAQVRAAFASVAAAIVGPTDGDVCSTTVEVVVPMKGTSAPFHPGKLTIKASAFTPTGARDDDGLKLACVPAS